MSQYQANPRIFHLDVLYHIFSYLMIHVRMGCIGYDIMGLNIDVWCSMIMQIGRNFTGTLINNYHQIYRIDVEGL